MTITPYHAKIFAYELTKRCSADSIEKLAGALVDAQVDLNPHQVEAALFAFHSPLSKGALLADEVGLGKTIEAGLVLSQKWAERKRRVLVITPANLRKQWHQEIQEKFFLPCEILEAKSYNDSIKRGHFRPLEIDDTIVICSYQFARSKAADVNARRIRSADLYKEWTSLSVARTLPAALQDPLRSLLPPRFIRGGPSLASLRLPLRQLPRPHRTPGGFTGRPPYCWRSHWCILHPRWREPAQDI